MIASVFAAFLSRLASKDSFCFLWLSLVDLDRTGVDTWLVAPVADDPGVPDVGTDKYVGREAPEFDATGEVFAVGDCGGIWLSGNPADGLTPDSSSGAMEIAGDPNCWSSWSLWLITLGWLPTTDSVLVSTVAVWHDNSSENVVDMTKGLFDTVGVDAEVGSLWLSFLGIWPTRCRNLLRATLKIRQ